MGPDGEKGGLAWLSAVREAQPGDFLRYCSLASGRPASLKAAEKKKNTINICNGG